MNQINKGVYPTMITPYQKDGEINYEQAASLVDYYYNKGCKGIFAVCQSSEMFYLSLKERVKLAKTVVEASAGRMDIVASGHISESIEAQAEEAMAVWETGVKAFVLVSNRLDLHNDGDQVWISNAERLLSKLPSDMTLGVYECPYPYKRLLTPAILDWMKGVGRFAFIKDTCCDPALLSQRLEQLKGSGIGLYNANVQTLLPTLQQGAAGFSSVMANFHPDLLSWLCDNWEKEPVKAQKLQNYLATYAFLEYLPYPMSAKYRLQLEGLGWELHARNRDPKEFNEYGKRCVEMAKATEDDLKAFLGI